MQHRRRILLINKRFQLNFCFFVSAWVLALCLPFTLALIQKIDYVVQVISRNGDAATLQQLQKFQSGVWIGFGLHTLFVVGVLFTVLLYLSHRIAGPAYRIQRALERWKKGTIEQGVLLRKGDFFRELADAYNDAAREQLNFQNQVRDHCKELTSLAADLDPKHRAQIKDWVGELQCSIDKKN